MLTRRRAQLARKRADADDYKKEPRICAVCLETLNDTIITVFPCFHFTCLECLSRMINPVNCPMCRFPLQKHLPEALKPPLPRRVTNELVLVAFSDESVASTTPFVLPELPEHTRAAIVSFVETLEL